MTTPTTGCRECGELRFHTGKCEIGKLRGMQQPSQHTHAVYEYERATVPDCAPATLNTKAPPPVDACLRCGASSRLHLGVPRYCPRTPTHTTTNVNHRYAADSIELLAQQQAEREATLDPALDPAPVAARPDARLHRSLRNLPPDIGVRSVAMAALRSVMQDQRRTLHHALGELDTALNGVRALLGDRESGAPIRAEEANRLATLASEVANRTRTVAKLDAGLTPWIDMLGDATWLDTAIFDRGYFTDGTPRPDDVVAANDRQEG